MLHLKNSKYLPKDATTILNNSRDLIYGMAAVIRDCRVSSKFIELDISVHKNNLELLLEKYLQLDKMVILGLSLKKKLKKNN